MTLKAELEKLRDRIEGNLSPTMVAAMQRDTERLRDSGIEGRVLQHGASAPAFELPSQSGDRHTLEALLAQGPVAVTFYRGFWCPYCNAELAALQRVHDRFTAAGARLLAISPEKPEYSRKVRRLHNLEFDILHDHGNEVADAFGLRFQMTDELRVLYRDQLNINLSLYNGHGDWTLPIPARFLIDQQGVVRYAEFSADYTVRPEPEALVDALQSL